MKVSVDQCKFIMQVFCDEASYYNEESMDETADYVAKFNHFVEKLKETDITMAHIKQHWKKHKLFGKKVEWLIEQTEKTI